MSAPDVSSDLFARLFGQTPEPTPEERDQLFQARLDLINATFAGDDADAKIVRKFAEVAKDFSDFLAMSAREGDDGEVTVLVNDAMEHFLKGMASTIGDCLNVALVRALALGINPDDFTPQYVKDQAAARRAAAGYSPSPRGPVANNNPL